MIRIILYCSLYATLNVGGAAIIKAYLRGKSLMRLNEWLNFIFSLPIILAFIIIFASSMVMLKTLSIGQFSSVIPIATGINFIFTSVLAYFLFKDQINLHTIIGFTLIIIGVILISYNHIENAK
jgi:uncharacterized membrane protein